MEMITEAAVRARESVRVLTGTEVALMDAHKLELNEPFVCNDAQVAGMRTPVPLSENATRIASLIGTEKLVNVVRLGFGDVKVMSLGDFAREFDQVAVLDVSDSSSQSMSSVSIDLDCCPFETVVQFPNFVRRLDWCDSGLRQTILPEQVLVETVSVNALLGFYGGGLFDAQLAMVRTEGNYPQEEDNATPLGFDTNTSPAGSEISSSNSIVCSEVNGPTHDRLGFAPKRVRFCLMTTAGSFTDFHIDTGGTSSFYYICQGELGLYLIRPSSKNIEAFTKWRSSEPDKRGFFGDEVDICYRCTANAGTCLYIPSGWIYGVFAIRNSVIVGTNFLSTLQIPSQLQVLQLEEPLPRKATYPDYIPVLWSAVVYYECNFRQNELFQVSPAELSALRELVGFLKRCMFPGTNPNNNSSMHQGLQLIRGSHSLSTSLDYAKVLQLLEEQVESKARVPPYPSADPNQAPKPKLKSKRKQTTNRRQKFEAVVPTSSIAGVESNLPEPGSLQPELKTGQAGASLQVGSRLTAAHVLELHTVTTGAGVNQQPTTSEVTTAKTNVNNETTVANGDYVRCTKCKGYFTKKGLGPHQKRCAGKAHPRYAKPRVVLTAGTNTPAKDNGKKHRSSCHRCGNLRPQVVACSECPVIFCRRCSAKMVEEYTVKAFEKGCPVCKMLCCCSNRNPVSCSRKYHCYKKCKAQRKNK